MFSLIDYSKCRRFWSHWFVCSSNGKNEWILWESRNGILSGLQINFVIFSFILDAFCRCVVTNQSRDTFVVWCTRSPTWDMTMKYTNIELWGDVTEFAVNPPIIVLEVFDKDAGVSNLKSKKNFKVFWRLNSLENWFYLLCPEKG